MQINRLRLHAHKIVNLNCSRRKVFVKADQDRIALVIKPSPIALELPTVYKLLTNRSPEKNVAEGN